jgi:hypothetical protein
LGWRRHDTMVVVTLPPSFVLSRSPTTAYHPALEWVSTAGGLAWEGWTAGDEALGPSK